jgi:hypothetical protein
MAQAKIDVPTPKIADFCLQHRIRELALFGSVLRQDFGPESDVDILIDFEPGVDEKLTLLDLVGIQNELSEIMQHNVDLVLKDGLKPFIREEVLNNSAVIYAL